jgi:hypothetical protein
MKGLVGAMSAMDLTGGPSKKEIVDANLALDPTLLDRISAVSSLVLAIVRKMKTDLD